MVTDTKTVLLDQAEYAVRSRGFDGFSYADLAEAVGIRKASIHYHFPTKAALSEALIDRYHTHLVNQCAEMDALCPTAAARLQALIALYRDALNGGKTLCLCISLIGGRESLTGDVMHKLRTFRAMMTGWIETVFALGTKDGSITGITDPRPEARATLALLEGAHLSARAEEDIDVFDEAVALLRQRCRGNL